jgi:hypothetical protein
LSKRSVREAAEAQLQLKQQRFDVLKTHDEFNAFSPILQHALKTNQSLTNGTTEPAIRLLWWDTLILLTAKMSAVQLNRHRSDYNEKALWSVQQITIHHQDM